MTLLSSLNPFLFFFLITTITILDLNIPSSPTYLDLNSVVMGTQMFPDPPSISPAVVGILREVSLISWSGSGGRLKAGIPSTWNLNHRPCPENDDATDSDCDKESTESEGSGITVNESLDVTATRKVLRHVVGLGVETPPEKRSVRRRKPDDCHILVRWLSVCNLIKQNMVCSVCKKPITNLTRRTIGIATEIDYSCVCRATATAYADQTNYSDEHYEHDLIRRERRIDNYDLNWRLIMATQQMGESQVGGSIIGLFLDLSRETFRNSWSKMEDLLGVEQRKIGQEVVDSNLARETMGKEATLCDDGVIRYPVSVSYDMGWQKARRTFDSMTGHGLMIGFQTQRVVCFQNYSKSCSKCEMHQKKMLKDKTPDVPMSLHHCPRNHDGSSKGMEAKAALACLNKVWTHDQIMAFVNVICLDDDASTKAYLSHTFADLDSKQLPRPTNRKGQPKTSTKDDKGRLAKDHPKVTFRPTWATESGLFQSTFMP